jgi:hypothetical protein
MGKIAETPSSGQLCHRTGEPGPAYLDFPVDVLRADVPEAVAMARAFGLPGMAWVPDLQPLVAWDEAECAWRRPALATRPNPR